MPLFRLKEVPCPVCGTNLKGENVVMHNVDHALPAPDGAGDFIWRCGCGEWDGAWDTTMGAAAGLTLHMKERHYIEPF